MKTTPRALLTLAILALLAACGGGGDDPPAPQPTVVWQATAAHIDPQPDARSVRSVTLRPSPALNLPTGVRGRECVEGTWTQQATGAGTFRLEMRAESFAIQPGGAQFTVPASATAAGTVSVPFRMCGNVDIAFPGGRSAAFTITARAINGNILGAYTLDVRWFIEGVTI